MTKDDGSEERSFQAYCALLLDWKNLVIVVGIVSSLLITCVEVLIMLGYVDSRTMRDSRTRLSMGSPRGIPVRFDGRRILRPSFYTRKIVNRWKSTQEIHRLLAQGHGIPVSQAGIQPYQQTFMHMDPYSQAFFAPGPWNFVESSAVNNCVRKIDKFGCEGEGCWLKYKRICV